MIIFRGLCVGSVFFLAACSSQPEPPQQATSANIHSRITMSELAAQNCSRAGGRLALARQLDGNSVGMCQLPNGKQCEEWALARGSCPAG